MNVEEYLNQNKQSIQQQCESIANSGAKPIVTIKKSDRGYIQKISTIEEFTQRIPDNDFFKKMRDGINNAVSHKVIPIVVFEGQTANIISLPDYFESDK